MANTSPPALEQLQADLIYLMNRYSGRPDEGTAGAIAMLLHGILNHPLIELFPELRGQCARGLNDWRTRAGFAMSRTAGAASVH